ncbi:MAG: hypothetical protein HWN66_07280 [Candidatus Helarchaeota archaeon]|nr:hypothetical protein [Candidatus Helarchaeota archaeon]
MEKIEKSIVKKEKEIEKLKQKLKEQEEKNKREQSRTKEEVKELGNRVRELLSEKKEIMIKEEQAVHEMDRILRAHNTMQDENKRLHEELTQVGILKAEMKGLELRIDTHYIRIKELETTLQKKDELIDQLKGTEDQLWVELKSKDEELVKKELQINALTSDMTSTAQSFEESEGKAKNLEVEIKNLNYTIDNQRNQINNLGSQINSIVNDRERLKTTVSEKENVIMQLKGEITSLNSRISELGEELAQIQRGMEAAEAGVISRALPNLVKGDDQAIEKIAQITQRIKHNAVITVPDFSLVPTILNLENLRTSTQLRIMAFVDFKNPKHKSIFDQFNRPNIMIRHTEERNLFGINRDHEELLIAPKDATGTPFGLVVKDPFQIEILGSIFLDIWGKCRRNVDDYEFSS